MLIVFLDANSRAVKAADSVVGTDNPILTTARDERRNCRRRLDWLLAGMLTAMRGVGVACAVCTSTFQRRRRSVSRWARTICGALPRSAKLGRAMQRDLARQEVLCRET